MSDEPAEDAPIESSWYEAARARRAALSAIMLLLLLLLLLLLIAAATERTDILRFASLVLPLGAPMALEARINNQMAARIAQSARNEQSVQAAERSVTAPQVDSSFLAYYQQQGGEQIFGRPISPILEVNGRVVQWFERARLERWPEYAGTPYMIQSGRVGAEFTAGVNFPLQTPFADRDDARFFATTGHGISGRFLRFWEQAGEIRTLGYPISDQVQEIMPDGSIYTVQYFERGRAEYHPEFAGTPSEMQLGLLGNALYLDYARPNIIPSPRPTPVPAP